MIQLSSKNLKEFLKLTDDGTFYIGHATVLARVSGKLYLVDGVLPKPLFLDSWLFFPELELDTALFDLVDAAFISHCHEDHYDIPFLKLLKKNTPIYICKDRVGLEALLAEKSLNVIQIPPLQVTTIDSVNNVLCIPSDHNAFDNSFVIKGPNFSFFQGNDNFLEEKSIRTAKELIGPVDHAYIPFAYVWWYPFCLTSMAPDQRQAEIKRLTEHNMKIGAMMAEVFEAKLVVPSAANLVFYESVESTINAEIATPFEFVEYVKENHPKLLPMTHPLLAGDYVLHQKSGEKIFSANKTKEMFFADLNVFLTKMNSKIPPAKSRSSIKDTDLNFLRKKLPEKPTAQFDMSLYFYRYDLKNQAIKVDMNSNHVSNVSSPEKHDRSIHFAIQPHAFEMWVNGEISLETILNSQRFLVHRNPEVFNREIWDVVRTQYRFMAFNFENSTFFKFYVKAYRFILSKYLVFAEERNSYPMVRFALVRKYPKFVYTSPHIQPQIAHLIQRYRKEFVEDFSKNIYDEGIKNNYVLLTSVNLDEVSVETIALKDGSDFKFKAPRVMGEPQDETIYSSPLPPRLISKVLNATVAGAFQIIVKDKNFVIYDESSEPSAKRIVSGVWRYFSVMDEAKKIIYTICLRWPKTEIKRAILISGRAPINYFHWLIEDLPKLMLVEQAHLDKSLPLLVDSKIPAQFQESLRIFTDRELVSFDSDKNAVQVEELYIPSNGMRALDDFYSPYWKGGAVSPDHLGYVRSKVLSKMPTGKLISTGYKKIYLSRLGFHGRSVLNSEEVEKLVESLGYEIVYPETLSFLEQVSLFNSADVIMGPGGAAFTNILFCKPGAVLAMVLSERNKGYVLFSNIANFAGATLINIPGPHEFPESHYKTQDEYAHSSFYGNLEMIRKFDTEYANSATFSTMNSNS